LYTFVRRFPASFQTDEEPCVFASRATVLLRECNADGLNHVGFNLRINAMVHLTALALKIGDSFASATACF
jgi:hypothetical protein